MPIDPYAALHALLRAEAVRTEAVRTETIRTEAVRTAPHENHDESGHGDPSEAQRHPGERDQRRDQKQGPGQGT